MKSAGQLYKEIQAQIWPSGPPENLAISGVAGVLAPHQQHFQEALADIAKFSRCEQSNVVNVVDFCKTFFKCGMTATRMPNGIITSLATVVATEDGPDYCDAVTYVERSYKEVECLGRCSSGAAGALPSLIPTFPIGFTAASAATDSRCGRARAGIWAKRHGNIFVAPWIQSVEQIVIEWDGIKSLWEDGDPMNEEQDYKLVVQSYCQYAHERDYGNAEKSGYYKGLYDRALAELIWSCEQKLKVRETPVCAGNMRRWASLNTPMEQTGIAPATADVILAHVGNIGSGSDRASVAALSAGFEPTAVVCSGNKDLVASYDISIGQYWHKYISPYYGAFDSGAEANMFWPAPGAGDWAADGLADWLAFFATPDSRRYYDVAIWPVHLFFFDSESLEPDGTIEDSAQGNWLQAKMLLSPAPWKIVVLYGNPYQSGVPSGASWPETLKLPFKAWGAHMVLSAGLPMYERLDVGGLPFIINGCGGATIASSASSAISESQLIATGKHGAGKITANKETLKYEFFDVASELIDTIELSK